MQQQKSNKNITRLRKKHFLIKLQADINDTCVIIQLFLWLKEFQINNAC